MDLTSHILSSPESATLFDVEQDHAVNFDEFRSLVLDRSSALEQQISPQTSVIVTVRHNTATLVQLLSVMRAGGVAIPVPPTASPSVLEMLISRLGTDARFLVDALATESQVRLTVLEKLRPLEWPCSSSPQVRAPQRAVGGSQPALVFLTSATTGQPKAVVLSHESLVTSVSSVASVLPMAADDRLALTLPLHHTYGLSSALVALARGATCVLLPPMQFPVELIDQLAQSEATVFAGVPAHYSALLGETSFSQVVLPRIRMALQAGGYMPVALTSRFLKQFPDADLYLMYGQTEASGRVTILDPQNVAAKPRSVGKPIPGVHICLRDQDQMPVATGEIGELYVTGATVMSHYYDDASASQHALTAHGLRTGDLCKMDRDGDLYVVGRQSDFAKIRGERVSAIALEETLLGVSKIHDCVVQVHRREDEVDDRLIARIVPIPGANPTEVLTEARRRVLHEHGTPAFLPEFVLATHLPRTASGKKRRVYLSEDDVNSAS